MFKTNLIRIASLLLLLNLACHSEIKKDKIITVSILPQKYFVDVLSSNSFQVNVMVPLGSSPETYEPTFSQMQNLASSMAYMFIGDFGFEVGLIPKIKEINESLPIFNTSEGIEMIEGTHQSHHGHDHDHDHVHGVDPHIWTSPSTAKIMAGNIARSLIQIDPQNSALYQQNLNSLNQRIDSIHSVITEKLKSMKSRKFIIYHPALSYFARDYQLEQISIEFEGKNPTASQLSKLISEARADSVSVVIIQKEFDVENAQTVAKELNAKIVQLNTLEENWFTFMDKLPALLLGEINE